MVTEADMTEEFAHPEAIVSTAWVAERLRDPSVVVAEIDSHLDEAYEKGHVPGAVGWGLHTDMEHPLRRDIPDVAQFEALMRRSGIERNTTVVLYGDGNNRSATWAFWVLKYYRHDDVRLMDGGRAKWVAEGRPLSMDAPTPAVRSYRAGRPDTTLRATKEHIVRNLGRRGAFRTLDTRTREEYLGEQSAAPGTDSGIYRSGRIPGAVHVQWDDAATEDGGFRPAGELARMYAGSGLGADQEVVPYCRLGVRASYSWFVLKYLLGYERVRNYDGSWTEWGNAAGVPIEKGE
jgi:thiosulfate/3-mercaptopyruvate sulfurtransferase